MNPTDETPIPPPKTSEMALDAQSGSAESFQLLYVRILPSVYAWAEIRIAPRLRRSFSPEDLVQEVWVRALPRFSQWDPQRGSFRAWIFGFCQRVLQEAVRAGPQRRVTARRTGGFDLESVPSEGVTVTRQLVHDEDIDRFLRFVGALDETDRELLLLRGLQGLPHEEVAEALDLTPATARKRWERLRAKLAEKELAQDLMIDG